MARFFKIEQTLIHFELYDKYRDKFRDLGWDDLTVSGFKFYTDLKEAINVTGHQIKIFSKFQQFVNCYKTFGIFKETTSAIDSIRASLSFAELELSPCSNVASLDEDLILSSADSEISIEPEIIDELILNSRHIKLNFEKGIIIIGKGQFGVVMKVKSKIEKRCFALKAIIYKEKNQDKIYKEATIFYDLTVNRPDYIVTYYSAASEKIKIDKSTSLMQESDSDDNIVFQEIPEKENNNSVSSSSSSEERANCNSNDSEEESEGSLEESEDSSNKENIQDSYKILFIKMELCDQTLMSWLESRESFNSLISAEIFYQIISAIEFIHSKDIIHRDLCPKNIFIKDITENGLQIKVGDFGLAKDSEGHLNLKSSYYFGTSPYSDPKLNKNNYTMKCDIYSCGIILLELFAETNSDHEFSKLLEDFKINQKFLNNEYVGILVLEMINKNSELRPSSKLIKKKVFILKQILQVDDTDSEHILA